MSVLDHEERISRLKKMDNATSQELRFRAQDGAKEFKTVWLKFAQALYAIWRDKLYEYWGYERFEHYTEREVGLKKAMALKLVKTYAFVEQEEPLYLNKDFTEQRSAAAVPEMDAIHVLRLARTKKELTKHDYADLRRQVFDKGRGALAVRKDLTALIKERKQVDPDEEREQRSRASLRRFLNALRSFQKDMETLKVVRVDILTKAEELFKELEAEVE